MTDNTFKLKVPLARKEGDTISSVTMRRMKVKDMRAIEKARIASNEVDAGAVALAALTDLPIEVIDEMDIEDFTVLSERMVDFLPKPKAALN